MSDLSSPFLGDFSSSAVCRTCPVYIECKSPGNDFSLALTFLVHDDLRVSIRNRRHKVQEISFGSSPSNQLICVYNVVVVHDKIFSVMKLMLFAAGIKMGGMIRWESNGASVLEGFEESSFRFQAACSAPRGNTTRMRHTLASYIGPNKSARYFEAL